ncbi:stalk domain-containing protein [Salsuginibacillus kocurii]|uniref:stalk domain-containing protein n=1 Tax=Salsuginibacillus kocurii TaxID=427078 RepID=UPI00038167C7|nr:stalk domain-containing protein [Salsuginibacillus kocurii]
MKRSFLKRAWFQAAAVTALTSGIFLFSNDVSAETITVNVDGEAVSFTDVEPEVVDQRVFVPLRSVYEQMGAEIEWNNEAQRVFAELEEDQTANVIMHMDSLYVIKGLINQGSSVIEIDAAPYLSENRTMIPLRISGEAFGYDVSWDQESRTVDIDSTDSLETDSDSFTSYTYHRYDHYPSDEGFEAMFHANAERIANGASPLAIDAELSYVSLQKSTDMIENDYFAHDSPTYGSVRDMLDYYGVSYLSFGENIARGHPDAESVTEGWMNSEGHRQNILNENYERIGVEEASGTQPYWTQLFTSQ